MLRLRRSTTGIEPDTGRDPLAKPNLFLMSESARLKDQCRSIQTIRVYQDRRPDTPAVVVDRPRASLGSHLRAADVFSAKYGFQVLFAVR